MAGVEYGVVGANRVCRTKDSAATPFPRLIKEQAHDPLRMDACSLPNAQTKDQVEVGGFSQLAKASSNLSKCNLMPEGTYLAKEVNSCSS